MKKVAKSPLIYSCMIAEPEQEHKSQSQVEFEEEAVKESHNW